jgi:hypothetical protein
LVIGTLAVCLVATASPHVARADEPSAAVLDKAREQFRKALSLEVAGNYEAALSMFKEVALIKSTPQVRFHIATCEEKMGDWVQAIGSYRLALHEAQQANAKDVTDAAGEAIATLEPKIPKLTITRGDGAKVASVELDGRALGGASVGAPMSVNPGPHVIKASAPGREPIQVEMTVAERETKQVELVLPPAPEGAAAGGLGSGASAGDAAPAGPSAMKVAGFVTAGAGVVGLGISGVFFLMRQGAISDLDDQCGPDGTQCPADAQATFDNGQTYSTVATATFIGGLGALALGTVLILAAPKSPKRVGLVAGVTGSGASATLVGHF